MGKNKNRNKPGPDDTISPATGKSDETISRVKWKHLIIISLVCIAVYSNTLSMDFVWDDAYQIKENSQIKSLKNIPSLFMSEVWAGVEGGLRSPYYRPVFTLSLALDYFLWGGKSYGFHLTNILLHLMVSIISYYLTYSLARSYTAAFFATLLFAVHPVHAEAVAWVSGRNELLCAFFMFLSFYLYILYRERRGNRYIVASLFAFFIALLSKEMAITLPLIILLYEVSVTDGPIQKRVLMPFIYTLVIIPYFLLRLAILNMQTWASFPLEERFYTGFGLLIEYFRLLIYPINLKLHYDIPIKIFFTVRDVLVPMLLFFGICCGILATKKFDRTIFFGLTFVLVALFPVSGFPTLIQPSLMADRYLYIPSFGFTMAAGLIFSMLDNCFGKSANIVGHWGNILSEKKSLKVVKSVGVLLISVLFFMTFQRNFVWKDELSFTTQRVKDAPHYAVSHYDFGLELSRQKRYDEAINAFQKAVSMKPDFVAAYNNIGAVYMDKGLYDEALIVFQKAVSLRSLDANTHYNLGIIYASKGQLEESEREFLSALKIKPNDANIIYNLGAVCMRAGKINEAIVHFENAVRIRPDNEIFRKNLNKAYEFKQKVR